MSQHNRTTFEELTLRFGNKDAAAFHRFKGFTSAVITDQKLSDAVKESLAQSLEQGTSLEVWRKDVDKIFDKQGVTRLNSFQAELINRNESNMAFGAGQFAKLQRNGRTFPYFSISTRKDHRVRDSHRALEGKVFKYNDSEFFPPLGINCRCAAMLISKYEAQKRGITKPDTITPEMRANLQNVEFVGDKVGNYADWLKVKMEEMPEAYKNLIADRLAETQREIQAGQHDTYKADSNYKTITSNPDNGTFVVQHTKADKTDLKINLDAAKRLHDNNYSVVVQPHQLEQGKKNPEFLIINSDGTQHISDLKTPDPTKYSSIENGIRNSFHAAVRQQINHVTIDVVADESLERIAEGVRLAFERYAQIISTIILKGAKTVEVTREDYMTGKILDVLQNSL